MQSEYCRGHLVPIWLCLIALLSISAPGSAHSDSLLVAELEEEKFFESVQEDVFVSGTVLVGIAAADAQSGPATLAGLVLQTSERRVCLTTQSRDGVYFSRNTYKVSIETDALSLIQLPYEKTERRDLILSYEQGDLAVQVTPGSCTQGSRTYLIAARDQSFETVDLMINGLGATEVFYRAPDGTDGSCAQFMAGRRTSYDYQCSIPRSQLDQGRQVILIERERYGRPLGNIEVEVQLSPKT